MIDAQKAVELTEYKVFFDTIPLRTIFVYDNKSSIKLWDKFVEKGVKSYFNLLDENWIVSKKKKKIGEWIEAYNTDNNQFVSHILENTLNWSLDSKVRFFCRRNLVLETNWQDFLLYWDSFLALEDDCPVLMETNHLKSGILFNAIGDIFCIE